MTKLTVNSSWADIYTELLRLEAEIDRLREPYPKKDESFDQWCDRLATEREGKQ